MTTRCPQCGRSVEERAHTFLDVKARVATCKACHLAGIVGSAEDWVHIDDPDRLARLHDIAERVEVRNKPIQVRYGRPE